MFTNLQVFTLQFFADLFHCKSCCVGLVSDTEKLLEHTQFCQFMSRKTPSDRYICFSCNYNSNLRESMRKHIRKHTGAKPFKCCICSYCTTQNSALKTHMMIKHSWEHYLKFKMPKTHVHKSSSRIFSWILMYQCSKFFIFSIFLLTSMLQCFAFHVYTVETILIHCVKTLWNTVEPVHTPNGQIYLIPTYVMLVIIILIVGPTWENI